MTTIKISQEYASLVPPMSEEEYQSLKQDIRQKVGLDVPIFVNEDGIILDGHHRYRACEELGIKIKESDIITKRFADKQHEKMFVIVNSKNGLKDEEVRIVQRWDGFRPSIKPLLFRFDLYLLVSKSMDLHKKKTKWKKKKSYEPKAFSTNWRKK